MTQYTIMQVPFHTPTREMALETLLGFLESERNHLVVTPNPEAVMLSQRDGAFLQALQQADLVLPDAIGILIAAKWLRIPMPSRVPGCDITFALLEAASLRSSGVTAFILGAAPGVALTAAKNLQAKFPGLHILGTKDGYFDADGEIIILDEIKRLKPDILLVGMGMPRQELWAVKHLHGLPCKITLCIGGSIDIMAGTVKRAPRFMQRVGLEWLYRLITQPTRAKRMLVLPLFLLEIFCKGRPRGDKTYVR